jgi:hypothetical protein
MWADAVNNRYGRRKFGEFAGRICQCCKKLMKVKLSNAEGGKMSPSAWMPKCLK